jgi:hypothetical protein
MASVTVIAFLGVCPGSVSANAADRPDGDDQPNPQALEERERMAVIGLCFRVSAEPRLYPARLFDAAILRGCSATTVRRPRSASAMPAGALTLCRNSEQSL